MDGSGKADASSGSNSHSATWDQKHWQQLNLDEKGKIYLADMLILIMRVAVRAIFSRSDIRVAQVCYADGMRLFVFLLRAYFSLIRSLLRCNFLNIDHCLSPLMSWNLNAFDFYLKCCIVAA